MTGFSEHGARRDRRAWWLFFAMFLLLAAGSRGTISNIDTQIRYMVAWRIYDDASVHPHPDELLATGGEFATGRHGDPVSPYGLGQSITMLPAVAQGAIGIVEGGVAIDKGRIVEVGPAALEVDGACGQLRARALTRR